MLEIILIYCLLFINAFYLYILDVTKNFFLLNSQNNNTIGFDTQLPNINIQSAENCKGFSETIRQLPDTEDYKI